MKPYELIFENEAIEREIMYAALSSLATTTYPLQSYQSDLTLLPYQNLTVLIQANFSEKEEIAVEELFKAHFKDFFIIEELIDQVMQLDNANPEKLVTGIQKIIFDQNGSRSLTKPLLTSKIFENAAASLLIKSSPRELFCVISIFLYFFASGCFGSRTKGISTPKVKTQKNHKMKDDLENGSLIPLFG